LISCLILYLPQFTFEFYFTYKIGLIIGLLLTHSFINILDKANKTVTENTENKNLGLYKQALHTVNNDNYTNNTICL